MSSHLSLLHSPLPKCITLQLTACYWQCTALCYVMHYTVLHCTATECTILEMHGTVHHWTALHRKALHCSAQHCIVSYTNFLYHTALYFITLPCTAWTCSTLKYTAMSNNALFTALHILNSSWSALLGTRWDQMAFLSHK